MRAALLHLCSSRDLDASRHSAAKRELLWSVFLDVGAEILPWSLLRGFQICRLPVTPCSSRKAQTWDLSGWLQGIETVTCFGTFVWQMEPGVAGGPAAVLALHLPTGQGAGVWEADSADWAPPGSQPWLQWTPVQATCLQQVGFWFLSKVLWQQISDPCSFSALAVSPNDLGMQKMHGMQGCPMICNETVD